MFKNALNKPKIDLQVAPTKAVTRNVSKPVASVFDAPKVPRIERVVNKGRIDLLFGDKTPPEVAERLLRNGAVQVLAAKRWEMADNYDNRVWLEYEFGADFGEEGHIAALRPTPESERTLTPPEPTSEPLPEPPVATQRDIPTETPLIPVFARCQQQMTELAALLNVRHADLLILAIDHLHTAKLGAK